ncbi:hypothetical protein BGZ61DRAFT_488202 [Ilyonectria robusta]|uniref:uncharacterized protein n=1 Tax=Ilyonectria robusta TaxID=1079257 RepID=UPI001E8E1D3C|nr:uncharacterized protein BGZ61DRAFT_488202 [Ilyonectria robusta]KAH8647096.1 hypothetical protein BGZ61DRAFT_488202 [Ilyonectria robusta]
MAGNTDRYPRFEDLPLRKGDPPFSSWGLWGVDDQVGTINHLTPEVVRKAAREITSGNRFSLNWPLNTPKTPGFQRSSPDEQFRHELCRLNPQVLAFDDRVSFNTQVSTQVDGLRHFAYQDARLFYNGHNEQSILAPGSTLLGTHHWHTKGGLVGRGVLIDFWSYAQRHQGKGYDPCAIPSQAITFDDIMACFHEQQQLSTTDLLLHKGDMIIFRMGYVKQYERLTPEEERDLSTRSIPETCGISQDERMLKFLWDHRVSFVGSDTPAWEKLPPVPGASFLYHEVLIAGWGCPIGEMLVLDELAEACLDNRKWTFFLSSAPLNVPGGVASPANIIAIL